MILVSNSYNVESVETNIINLFQLTRHYKSYLLKS